MTSNIVETARTSFIRCVDTDCYVQMVITTVNPLENDAVNGNFFKSKTRGLSHSICQLVR
jgi:hypothetical protein